MIIYIIHYLSQFSFLHSEVMQRAGEVQSSLAKELAEYEMQVEKDVLAPMTSLLEVIIFFMIINTLTMIPYFNQLYGPFLCAGS